MRRPRPRRLRRSIAVVMAAALALAACGGSDSATTPNPDDVLASDVFDATARTVSGDAFQLGTLADQDLVLWFWAPW